MLGHSATVFEPKEKLGGLNEYGIAAYKTPDDFAAREVEYILSIGGIDVRTGVALGKDFSLGELRAQYDAVFLGIGLAGVNDLDLDNEQVEGVANAVDYIATLRQVANKASLPVGRRVVVIGGGMTAIDIAVQSKALGAEEVTMVYRRGQESMNASRYEQEFAQIRGVTVRYWSSPRKLLTRMDASAPSSSRRRGPGTTAVSKERDRRSRSTRTSCSRRSDRRCCGSGSPRQPKSSNVSQDRIVVDEARKDFTTGCVGRRRLRLWRRDLTVSAVQDGKLAALSIDRFSGRRNDLRLH